MIINIYVLNAQQRLHPRFEENIRHGVNDAALLLSNYLDMDAIDVVIQLCESSIYGRAYGPESFTIYVNPTDPGLNDFWDSKRFCQLSVHEFHHVLRWRSLKLDTFSDWTPGEVLALEGLATQCEAFLGLRAFEAVDKSAHLIEPLLERLKPDVGARYRDVRWIDEACLLLGHNVRAASAMGHLLAGRYLERTGQTPITAIHAPWQDVWTAGMGATAPGH